MTTAVHQWRPAFAVTQSNLEGRLDRASRGLNSHSFTLGTSRRAFISGFDPFGFGSGILASNPSGVAVLPLDGTVLNGAEVQAIVLPVRYADFDAGMVEDAFGQHIGTGTQAATIITSVSQGGDDFAFDLEFYNGRNRASQGPGLPAIPDNRNEFGGSGTYDRPVAPTFPLNQTVTSQFTMTSLPVDDMLQSGPAEISTQVDQQFPAGSRSAPRADGFTVGASAVQGSGGGFLSNEVAYRVTRLRDELHSNVAAGHVHTAFLRVPSSITDPTWEAERRSIASQYRGMLFQAIPVAGVSVPVALTLNKTTYRVGEVPTYSVIGPANKPLKWSSTFNGVPTSESDTSYGTMTDANRRWSGTIGPAWTAAQVGSWVKYVRVDGRLAQFAFTVTN
jgi:pyrrolidone-carboxylate peptidase